MSTRRQEKAARLIREAVSGAIANHLSDPRIEGLVSVTRVEVAPDLRTAEVYLSIFGKDTAAQNRTYEAITHARSRIQSLLADEVQSKFCPVLRFQMDESFKKAMETLKLIEETTREREKKESADPKPE